MHQSLALCERRARLELDRLGDARLGEWTDTEGQLGRIVHLRRRLASWEGRGLKLRDIRGTHEARLRAERLGARLAVVPPYVLRAELGTP